MSTQFGLNIGNDQSATNNAPYPVAQNAADLAFLKPYTNWLRIALTYGLDQNDTTNLRHLATDAIQAGYKVTYGITAGADATAATYYNQWLATGILAAAAWAQANGVSEFQIGNEEDWNASLGSFSPKTAAQVQADIRAIVPAVKKIFTNGPVTYCTAEGMLQDWITGGLGGLDMIYFNVYDTDANFQSIVSKIESNFGAKGAVSEWNAQHGYDPTQYSEGTGPVFDAWFAADIKNRANMLEAAGISKAFLFTWRYLGSGWAFCEDGTTTLRPGFANAFPSATTTPPVTPPTTPPTTPPVTAQKFTGTFSGTFSGTLTGTIE